jgi:hypothetical protein
MNRRTTNTSGSSDLFERAVAGLRASGGKNEDAEALRARIMVSLHHRDRRRTTAIVFLIPLAAVLVGSTAWGAGTGRLRSAWHALMTLIPRDEPAPVRAKAGPAAALQPRVHAVERAVPEPLVPPRPPQRIVEERAPEPTVMTRPVPVVPVRPSAPRPPVTAKPVPEPADNRLPARDAQALYRTAHKAHFVDLEPARALDAWDAYLAAFPSGAFALEARYNRALCLVRLGRAGEARQALAPFARGDYGDYRRAEARALLEAFPQP